MCVFTLRDMEVFHLHQKKSRCQRPGNAPTVNDLVESDFQQKLPGGFSTVTVTFMDCKIVDGLQVGL